MTVDFDIVVIGSGFGGSLLAMAARQLGRSVAMLERSTHPRFAIGESSTPLANLLLEQISRRYQLERLRPLSKWGSWQQERPQLGCGLKRGFTFYHHAWDLPWQERNQLLVAASPHDAIADTHWYRPDFDAYLVQEAQALGVTYLDQTQVQRVQLGEPVVLEGQRATRPLALRARWVIDASGPRGCLHRLLNLPCAQLPHLPPTQAVYSHFRGVRRWEELFPPTGQPPFPPDDAALHHIFPGGWIWVLRFNNGLTSAGVAAETRVFEKLNGSDPSAVWRQLLTRLPSVQEQFRDARMVFPPLLHPALSFRTGLLTGPGWVLLPSAAGFIDPLLSTGFPLTLLGVERLADLIAQHWDRPTFATGLAHYARQTERDLLAAAGLVAALYSAMDDPALFNALTLLYFAAASFSETVRRLGRTELLGPTFLCAEHPVFGSRLASCLRAVQAGDAKTRRKELLEEIYTAIQPIDVAGLSDRTRHPWYPVRATDLLGAAEKVQSARGEIETMLKATGFV